MSNEDHFLTSLFLLLTIAATLQLKPDCQIDSVLFAFINVENGHNAASHFGSRSHPSAYLYLCLLNQYMTNCCCRLHSCTSSWAYSCSWLGKCIVGEKLVQFMRGYILEDAW